MTHRRKKHRALIAVVAALRGAAAQPPCAAGLDFPTPDVAVVAPPPVAAGAEAQACAWACRARPDCRAFTFVATGGGACGGGARGCCHLKANGTRLNATADASACGSVMRHDPSTYPPPPAPAPPPPPGARSVLHVIVDDLRPDLAPYGPAFMSTPALAAFAAGATRFTRAYANVAVCSPSRMSFLTGRAPSVTSVWNFVNHFRQDVCYEEVGIALDDPTYATVPIGDGGAGQCCSHCAADGGCAGWTLNAGGCHLKATAAQRRANASGAVSGGRPVGAAGASKGWTTLPGAFLRAGYAVFGVGKVFHTEEGGNGPLPWDGQGMPPLQDPPSWTRDDPNATQGDVNSVAPMWPCAGGGADACSEAGDDDGTPGPGVKPFEDRVIGDEAVARLAALAAARVAGGPPWYLAVGFRKPHLPFRHPSAYDARYPPPANISLARYDVLDASVPPIAFHTTSLAVDPYAPMAPARSRRLRRDYYAATSWVDHEVGRVLAALDAAGAAADTLVVFHADHGWSLGEHGEWEKFTNFEHGTRVPLIVRAPWVAGSGGTATPALAELIDVMPTVLDLVGVAPPPGETLDGQSLAPALVAAAAGAPPPTSLRPSALSVYPRCPATRNASLMWQANDCLYVERARFFAMGVSLRTDRWRYTEWVPWNGTALAPDFGAPPVGVELYDHAGDDGSSFDGAFEVVNLAGDAAHAGVRTALAAQARAAYAAPQVVRGPGVAASLPG